MPPYASGFTKTIKRKAKKSYTSSKAKMFKAIVGAEHKGPELKAVDVNSGGAAPVVRLVSTTATIDLLNGTAIGSAAFNRIGRSVSMKSLRIRGALFPSGNAGTTAGEYLSMYAVYDRQVNGAFPTFAAMFQTLDQGGNGSNGSFDFPNINNSERFIILGEEHFQIPTTSTTGGSTNVQPNFLLDQTQKTSIDRLISLKNLPTNYMLDTGVIGAVASGAIYLVTVGSQAAATAGVTFNYVTRIRYTDA